MDIENIFASISEKLNTLNFVLEANYDVLKASNQFQLSANFNERFCGIKADFSKI